MESSLPGVKFRPGDTFLGTELSDRQTAGRLTANAIAPKSHVPLGRGFLPSGSLLERDELVHFTGYQALQEWLFRTLTAAVRPLICKKSAPQTKWRDQI